MPTKAEFRKIEVDPSQDLLTREELAWCLRVHRSYVDAMVRSGFFMPAGTSTLNEARQWLRENPKFRKN